MNRIILSAIAAASFAAPALASDQLAASLGVEPGVYTTAELIQLKDGAEVTSNERIVVKGDAFNFAADATAAQLAESLGVEPGRYSVAELAILKNASTFTDNEGTVYFGDSVAFSASEVSPQFGIYGDVSLAKAIELKDATEVSTNERIVFIR